MDQHEKTEVEKDHIDFVHKVFETIILSTDSQLTTSSDFEFLSFTDPTEERLSDCGIRKRADPELIAPIKGPESELQEVKYLWGPEASTSLEKILAEFDDLFMKHKAEIGRCTIAKHPVEVEPTQCPTVKVRGRTCQSGSTVPACAWHDPVIIVPLGKRYCNGQGIEWRVTLLLRLPPTE